MSERVLKVNELIKRELNQILLKELEFSQELLITITRVETTSNLIQSKVYISVIPENQTLKTLRNLNGRIYFLQQKLNQRLKMRPIPKIIFLKEKETGQASRIEEVLEQLKKGEK